MVIEMKRNKELKGQSTTKGFAILSAAGMITKILSLLYIPFLLTIIKDEGLGIYNQAYQIYVFIYVLTNAGIPSAISKLVSELISVHNYRDAIKTFKIARYMLLVMGIAMSLIMMIFAFPMTKLLHIEKSALAVLYLSPAILFTSIASAYRGYFQGRGNMTPTAVSQVLEQIMNTVFTLIFASMLMKYGVIYGCAGGTIGTTIGAFASALYLMIFYEKNKVIKVPVGYKNMYVERNTNKQLVRKIIHYGVPITLCVGMTYAGNLVDLMNTMSRLGAAGFNAVEANIKYGYLVKYQQLINVPIAIITALSMAILPAISGAAALKDKENVVSKINYSFRLAFMISIPSAVGLAVLSAPIFKLIFTQKYYAGSELMLYGSAVLVLTSVMQIQTTILQGIGKLYTATFYSVLGIIFKVAANYFLIAIPSINIKGAVLGSIVGYSIPVILNHKVIKRSLKLEFKFLSHSVKPLISSAIMGAVAWAVYHYLSLLFKVLKIKSNYMCNAGICIIAIIMGAFTYMFGMILTRGISSDDIQNMPRKVTRLIPNFMLKKVH